MWIPSLYHHVYPDNSHVFMVNSRQIYGDRAEPTERPRVLKASGRTSKCSNLPPGWKSWSRGIMGIQTIKKTMKIIRICQNQFWHSWLCWEHLRRFPCLSCQDFCCGVPASLSINVSDHPHDCGMLGATRIRNRHQFIQEMLLKRPCFVCS